MDVWLIGSDDRKLCRGYVLKWEFFFPSKYNM